MRKTIVVFYNARWYLPLRATNEAHLRCWGRYSNYDVVYVNVAYGVPWPLLRSLPLAAVIFDTIFLSMHWSADYFREHSDLCLPVANLDCPKIAVVQDEFYNIDLVAEFLDRVGITHVLTCSCERDWPKFYRRLDRAKVLLRTLLTGYVDETRISKGEPLRASKRAIDIGYRAWANPYWLGEHGQEKVRIGRIVGEAARQRGFRTDINNPEAMDFLIGDDWYAFLAKCRCVLGVEGGASVMDHDGSIKWAVDDFVRAHPSATFEEARAACFPGRDNEINLSCLSPRHLEACITRTCQVLLEGGYNGVLRPWEHYIPIKKDYSNLEQVFDAIEDDALVDRLAQNAYRDIVDSGKWSYECFVSTIERDYIGQSFGKSQESMLAWLARHTMQDRERALWRFAYFESAHRKRVWMAYGRLRGVGQWLRQSFGLR